MDKLARTACRKNKTPYIDAFKKKLAQIPAAKARAWKNRIGSISGGPQFPGDEGGGEQEACAWKKKWRGCGSPMRTPAKPSVLFGRSLHFFASDEEPRTPPHVQAMREGRGPCITPAKQRSMPEAW